MKDITLSSDISVNDYFNTSNHQDTLSRVTGYTSGAYIYRLRAGKRFVQSRKLLLVK